MKVKGPVALAREERRKQFSQPPSDMTLEVLESRLVFHENVARHYEANGEVYLAHQVRQFARKYRAEIEARERSKAKGGAA